MSRSWEVKFKGPRQNQGSWELVAVSGKAGAGS